MASLVHTPYAKIKTGSRLRKVAKYLCYDAKYDRSLKSWVINHHYCPEQYSTEYILPAQLEDMTVQQLLSQFLPRKL